MSTQIIEFPQARRAPSKWDLFDRLVARLELDHLEQLAAWGHHLSEGESERLSHARRVLQES